MIELSEGQFKAGAMVMDTSSFNQYGFWSIVQSKMISRTGKQCRERYLNHLNPNIKHTAWSTAEDKVIIRLHSDFGSKWRLYTSHLPGRTDRAIKNRWHCIERSFHSDQIQALDDHRFQRTIAPMPNNHNGPYDYHKCTTELTNSDMDQSSHSISSVETQQSWRLDKFCSLEKDAALEDTSSSSSNSIRSSATERAVYKGNTDPHDKVSAIPEASPHGIAELGSHSLEWLENQIVILDQSRGDQSIMDHHDYSSTFLSIYTDFDKSLGIDLTQSFVLHDDNCTEDRQPLQRENDKLSYRTTGCSCAMLDLASVLDFEYLTSVQLH